ncbi:HAD-IB family hydrolase [Spongiibacter sp. KMU-166]|uniref:HAD-IB family hydrolase n=1 Tax=Spongiibacter thalassae TaxID=2721624 RepID=A0ABX1GAZ1_9GAMM|nr:HAD-IB family hydrolase [Spongiibacter thalassae]NKI16121.1 HAD-IB family hydrolase [Spongiibacter thalassae]
MSSLEELYAEIADTPEGPDTLALFDFDGTLIAGYSSIFVLLEQLRRGDISKTAFANTFLSALNHRLGLLDDQGLMEVGASFIAGRSEEEFAELCQAVFEKQLYKRIYPEARALIAAHRAKGHTVAIASSAPRQAIAATAAELQIEHIASSVYLLENGVFNGKVSQPVCWGYGKRSAAEDLAESLQCSLDNAFFYSDSDEDLPLLEVVGCPVAVNPNTGLRQRAEQQDWHCFDFAPRKWRLRELGGTAGVYASLVATYLGGLGVARLQGDRDKGRSFMLNAFTDSVSALTGMKLKVVNEHYLNDSPAGVVIFNHQSTADGFIILKLLKENYAGIGKRAFGRIPLLSDAYEFAGVIPIDRSDSASAINSMAPLVDAIKLEGRSVAIAPEGTRSQSRKPGPFKKGAFHLALDAGANIIPVVIHNSMDVQGKGDKFFHPATVTVEILPPVDTRRWQRDTLDRHIHDVRNLYLEALGYPREKPPRRPRKTASIKSDSTPAKPAKARNDKTA